MIRRLVVIIHGIHTSKKDAKSWMPELMKAIVPAHGNVAARAFTYGWTSGAAIRLPIVGWFSRRRRTAKFQKFIAELRKEHPGAKIDVVAHSFGTWITHYSMLKGKHLTTLNRVVYMGGIVPQDEKWEDVPVNKVLCLFSKADKVVKMAPGFGESGNMGFIHADGRRVINRSMSPYRHGNYLKPGKAWTAMAGFLNT